MVMEKPEASRPTSRSCRPAARAAPRSSETSIAVAAPGAEERITYSMPGFLHSAGRDSSRTRRSRTTTASPGWDEANRGLQGELGERLTVKGTISFRYGELSSSGPPPRRGRSNAPRRGPPRRRGAANLEPRRRDRMLACRAARDEVREERRRESPTRSRATPVDLVHAVGSVSHRKLSWDIPEAAWLNSSGSAPSRGPDLFDKRGMGMSDSPRPRDPRGADRRLSAR